MGGGGSSAPASQPTQQTVTSNPIAEWAQPTATALIGSSMSNAFNLGPNGEVLSSRGFTPFGGATNSQGQFTGAPVSQDQYNQQLQVAGLGVAGPSALQQQSYQGAANLQVPGQYRPASQMAGYGTMQALGAGQNYAQQATDPNAVGAYMNPFVQNALAPALALQNQQFGQIAAQNAGQATQAGAFGGGRDAVMRGLNQQNQMLAQNQLVGNAYNQAYTNAQQAQQFGSNLGLQGAQAGIQGANTLAGIGGQQLAAQQGVLGTQNQMGVQEQQNQQNVINQAVQNYASQQQYPQQQTANIMNLIRSTPTTQTATTYQAPPSAVSQLGGLGATALGAYGASGGFKAKGGEIKEKKMASGGIASGVPAGKLPSMLANLSDQQLAQKSNLQANDPQTAADALSQQAFRANARQGVASAAGGGFVDMAGGGIVAFAKGGIKDDAVAKMGKYETPDRDTLANFYSEYPAPVDQNQLTSRGENLTKSMADYQALLPDKSDASAAYVEALKKAQPDKNEQLWGRLMQFGAGMAAGTSPNALTNIGAAAQQTVPGMLEDAKERRKAQGEMAKVNFEIANMSYADKLNLLKLADTNETEFSKRAHELNMNDAKLKNDLLIATNHDRQTGINAQTAAGATLGAATIGLEKTNAKDKSGIDIEFKSLVAQGWDPNSPLTMAQAQRGYFQSKSYSGQVAEAGVIEKSLATDKELGRLNSQLTMETLKKNPDKDKVKEITDQIKAREATVREKAAVQSNVAKPPPNNPPIVPPTAIPKPTEVYKGQPRLPNMNDIQWAEYKKYLDSQK